MATFSEETRTALILGMSSDIGRAMAERFSAQGWHVVGTYRDPRALGKLAELPRTTLIECDLSNRASLKAAAAKVLGLGRPWHLFLSSVGSLTPVGRFFDVDFEEWEEAIRINALSQLAFLHAVHPSRERSEKSHVAFFAGGGTNGPLPSRSSYACSKVFLIKICELLDNENPDLNVFILGPGWVRTKIHDPVVSGGDPSSESYQKTMEFLRAGGEGTPMDDIFDCLCWCMRQGRGVAGGRNFSVVHDDWKKGGPGLAARLQADPNAYKLRRFGNS